MGHGYPGVIGKAPLNEEVTMNQGDSRAHTESNPDSFTEECQTKLPNQDTETKPRVSPSWTDSSHGMSSGLKSSHDFIYTRCYIIDFIVHVLSYFLQSTPHYSCFISFALVHTSLIMFHFCFLQSTVHIIHFTYHSQSRSCLPYLVVFILHGHSSSLSVSLFSQKLTTYECV